MREDQVVQRPVRLTHSLTHSVLTHSLTHLGETEYAPSPNSSQSLASSLSSSPSKDSVSMKEKVLSRAFQDIIHWPIQSCRYVFLSEVMKTELGNILDHFRQLNIDILSPYRSKHDPLACILVSSDQMESVKLASVFIKGAALTHSPTHSLTYSLTRSIAHSLTHSLTLTQTISNVS